MFVRFTLYARSFIVFFSLSLSLSINTIKHIYFEFEISELEMTFEFIKYGLLHG